jgi:YhcH/YjgK/YiaL family protein
VIVDTLGNGDRYLSLHPLFRAAFRFLSCADFSTLPPGRHDIDGERLFAIVSRGPGRKAEDGLLETHDRYIDVQHVFSGSDSMGWKARSSLLHPEGPHDPERDLRFWRDRPDGWITVRAGSFALFYPEDGHLPLVSEGEIGKVVVKVEAG